MGKSFSIDHEILSNASKTLEDISGNYDRISVELMTKAENMGSAWESSDNLAFVDQIKGFADDLKKMSDRLLDDSKLLEAQSSNYKAHCEDNISQVKRLAN